jgi:hypothetical protein
MGEIASVDSVTALGVDDRHGGGLRERYDWLEILRSRLRFVERSEGGCAHSVGRVRAQLRDTLAPDALVEIGEKRTPQAVFPLSLRTEGFVAVCLRAA